MEEIFSFSEFHRAQQLSGNLPLQALLQELLLVYMGACQALPPFVKIFQQQKIHSLTVRAWDLTFKKMFATPCLSRVMGQV